MEGGDEEGTEYNKHPLIASGCATTSTTRTSTQGAARGGAASTTRTAATTRTEATPAKTKVPTTRKATPAEAATEAAKITTETAATAKTETTTKHQQKPSTAGRRHGDGGNAATSVLNFEEWEGGGRGEEPNQEEETNWTKERAMDKVSFQPI